MLVRGAHLNCSVRFWLRKNQDANEMLNDRAIELLRKDYEQRDNWMTWLKVDPVMDPLRSHPRFLELMRRLKLE